MRSIAKLMKDWQFTGPNGVTTAVELPHTWNARDGQDGGNDYWRGCCTYCTCFAAPVYDPAQQQVWLQFEGINASAAVLLNGQQLCTHDGGYSTFRAEVTELLQAENQLTVRVDNSVNDRVYPQKADFTFYGGIYRDVSLLVVNKNHIALGHFGDTGVKITPALQENSADIRVETLVEGSGTVTVELLDTEGRTVAKGEGENASLHLDAPHLWNGVKDPYLYTCVVRLPQDGQPVDEVTTRVGLRSFSVDAMCAACPFFLLTVRTSQKEGQKASLMKYVSVALVCYVGVLVLLLLWGRGDAFTLSILGENGLSINLYTILFIAFFGIGYGAYYATADMPIPMVADCSDYETYRSGKYIPGIMGTLFSLVDKLVSSLSATVVGIAVSFVGLQSLPTQYDPYTPGMNWVVIVLFCIIPMVAWAATLIAMKGYTLTGAKMKEIQAVNACRRDAVAKGMKLEEAMDKWQTMDQLQAEYRS